VSLNNGLLPSDPCDGVSDVSSGWPTHWYEMQVVYLNGRRLQVTWREMQGQFRHPLFVGMLLMMAFCIVLIGPYDHLLNFAALRLTIFYAVCFGSFTALLYLALFLCYRRKRPAYSVFTVGGACLGATLSGLTAALLLGAPVPSVKDMALVTGFNLVFCYLGETLQSTFIMPRILADLRGRPAREMLAEFIVSDAGAIALPHDLIALPDPPVPDMPSVVTIFGQTFATDSILLIEAEEHYVALNLSDGARQLLRGRIVDAVAAMPPHLGRRVHRSYWVSTAAVAGLRPEKSGTLLVLTNGRAVPVARPRVADVRAWVQSLSDPANKRRPVVKKGTPKGAFHGVLTDQPAISDADRRHPRRHHHPTGAG